MASLELSIFGFRLVLLPMIHCLNFGNHIILYKLLLICSFKWINWCLSLFHIRQLHIIILSPPFAIFFHLQSRHIPRFMIKRILILPEFFCLPTFSKLRQFLPMNSHCHIPIFLCQIINHHLLPLIVYHCLCLSSNILIP
jgi:hypothetical protein